MFSRVQKADTGGQLAAMQEAIASKLAADIAKRDAAQTVVDYENYLAQLLDLCRSKDPGEFNTLLTSAATALADYVNLNQNVIDAARGKPMLTLEYTFSQPAALHAGFDLCRYGASRIRDHLVALVGHSVER